MSSMVSSSRPAMFAVRCVWMCLLDNSVQTIFLGRVRRRRKAGAGYETLVLMRLGVFSSQAG